MLLWQCLPPSIRNYSTHQDTLLFLIAMLVELLRFVDEVLEAKVPLVFLAAYSKSGEVVAR